MESAVTNKIYEFGDFRLVPAEGLLLQKGTPISLNPKAFAVLVMLVERHGHLVTKSEILDAIWEGAFVEEGAIAKSVWFVRNALGDSSKENFIQTVPRRGYRFIAPVSVVKGSGAYRLSNRLEMSDRDNQFAPTAAEAGASNSRAVGPAVSPNAAITKSGASKIGSIVPDSAPRRSKYFRRVVTFFLILSVAALLTFALRTYLSFQPPQPGGYRTQSVTA